MGRTISTAQLTTMNMYYCGCEVPSDDVCRKLNAYAQLTRFWGTLRVDVVRKMSPQQRALFGDTHAALEALYPDGSWCLARAFVLSIPIDGEVFEQLLQYRSRYCAKRERYILNVFKQSEALFNWAQALLHGRSKSIDIPWSEYLLDYVLDTLDWIERNSLQAPFGFFWSTTTRETTPIVSSLLYTGQHQFVETKMALNGDQSENDKVNPGDNLCLSVSSHTACNVLSVPLQKNGTRRSKRTKALSCWTSHVTNILSQSVDIRKQAQNYASGADYNARLLIRTDKEQIRWRWEILDDSHLATDKCLTRLLDVAKREKSIVVTHADEHNLRPQHYIALFGNKN